MPQINGQPDATTTSKGKIQLAGGLRGTAISPQLAAGTSVQTVSTNFATSLTSTVILPHDDTIPTNTEGVEVMTQTITPLSMTNILVISFNVFASHSVATFISSALYQDSGAAAIAASASYQTVATGTNVTSVTYRMVAGTTSPTTFRVRTGGNDTGTLTFNGANGGRRFGGISMSNITITEVAV